MQKHLSQRKTKPTHPRAGRQARQIATAIAVMASTLPATGSAVPEILLWPEGAPGTQSLTNNETIKDGLVLNTFQPSLRVFLPPADTANGAAVIVCPGGGYNVLEIVREGERFAQRLNEMGVAAFVLKYRLRNHQQPDDQAHIANALADGQRAVRLVRVNAAKWRVNPTRVGIGGFSAGGYVSINVGIHGAPGQAAAADPVDRQSSRPDFLVLVYPSVRGLDADVTSTTPPAFLVHGDNDTMVPASQSLAFYTALHNAGVSAELHILADAPHGFDLGAPGTPAAAWPTLLHAWLEAHGWLAPRATAPRGNTVKRSAHTTAP